jgi:F-type H+-transporting ATPase subunit delta
MSFNSRMVTTYAKSLFQNLNNSKKAASTEDSFKISKITSSEEKNFLPDIFIVGEELLLLRATLISSEKLSNIFKNPTFAEKQKLDIILSIFPGLTVSTKSFLKVLTERGHLSLIPEISDDYNKIILKFKNTTKVKLVTASQLEEKIGSMLLTTLKKLTNSTEIILNTAYNPKLLGGVVLEYNSVAIDASILKEFSLFFNE